MSNKDLATVEEGEIIESTATAVSSPQAVMLTPKQLEKQLDRDTQMRGIISKYIKENMVDGKDYGSIVVKGAKSKPSLFKPGSEKFCGLFKIRASFRKDTETVEMLGNTSGIIAYVCELVDSRGRVVGEGRGIYKVSTTDSDFNINKAVKIAEKRAQIDAVLRTGGLSDFFTQDLEDAPRDFGSSQPAASAQAPAQPKKLEGPASDKQIGLAKSLLEKAGYNQEAIQKRLGAIEGKQDASDLISKLLNAGTTEVQQ